MSAEEDLIGSFFSELKEIETAPQEVTEEPAAKRRRLSG